MPIVSVAAIMRAGKGQSKSDKKIDEIIKFKEDLEGKQFRPSRLKMPDLVDKCKTHLVFK